VLVTRILLSVELLLPRNVSSGRLTAAKIAETTNANGATHTNIPLHNLNPSIDTRSLAYHDTH
jgi:hypothetical protein